MRYFDAAVIGGGILGCFAARNLRRWNISAALIESEPDVCTGITRSNTAIVYAGYDNKPGSLKAEMTVRGNAGFEALCKELEVPFCRCGSLMVSYGPGADKMLRKKYNNGVLSGVPGLRLISGGEPLVKKNILSICRRAAAVEGIKEVCLTTNGHLLPQLARLLRETGVRRLNLSLDSLDPDRYAYITRRGTLKDFMAGLDAAFEAGFDKIKLNAVLIGGFNDDEIVPLAELTRQYPVDMRFIEMMPMYDSGDFDAKSFVPYTKVLDALPEAQLVNPDGGVAKLYHQP